ncbi:acyl-CoA dehydrogenase family protein [Zwartia sp.]|uniref:acyl-CoA dehydrogenase family protein n=1 Tax=Zwartia sp. TaxID=2978004 RepID=UPI002716FC18|nr:acyl-CoA dehydrogenase family protein [Zwartia sp.]MDO9024867.1 acyl-CoA dehydrogenase family protein [Zwartia sp.]
MQNSFYDSADRFFAQECTPAHIRQIEQGMDPNPLWETLLAAGFVDGLLPENADGAGLTLSDVWPIMFCMGRHALPLPYAHTMLARAWLNHHGQPLPVGSITFAPYQVTANGEGLTAHAVNFGLVANWVLVQYGSQVWCLATDEATAMQSGGHGSLDADLTWPREVVERSMLGKWDQPQFRHLMALSLGVLIAGASDRVFELTLAHANQREQFGKPIGRFQALQQQISEVAELVFGARMATEMACRSLDWQPAVMLAALAKSQTSQAVSRVTAVAHAVHGAIGVTHEYDLQLFTRRLNEWARAGGGQAYWAEMLGREVLGSKQSTLDFIRSELFLEGQPE